MGEKVMLELDPSVQFKLACASVLTLSDRSGNTTTDMEITRRNYTLV